MDYGVNIKNVLFIYYTFGLFIFLFIYYTSFINMVFGPWYLAHGIRMAFSP